MIEVNSEFYHPPYYFYLRDKGNKYSLYFSSENTLTEARKKDDVIHFDKKNIKKVKSKIKNIVNSKKPKKTKEIKTDLEELVNSDGAMSTSKVPILDPALHPTSTMDQTVPAARITNDPIARGYRTYYGESVDDLLEIDMSDAYGYEETEDMDGKDTYLYYKNELDMDDEEAKNRTRQQGKDPSGKKDKKSEYYNDKNFITRSNLYEIQKQKMIKVLEDILMNKKTDKSDIKKNKLPTKILKSTVSKLIHMAKKDGLSVNDLIKLIRNE